MYELVLQLTLELMHSTSSRTWEKDAGLLLRLENVHESLFNEIVQQMKDAITICSKDEAILFPDIVLADQVNYCRLRVVIKCVSDLFRLELKRRNQMKTALGDKKYWYFIHLFRSQLRDFNDYLEGCSENENDTNEGDTDEDDEDNHDEETDRTSPLPDRKIELLRFFGGFPEHFSTNGSPHWFSLSLLNGAKMPIPVTSSLHASYSRFSASFYSGRLMSICRHYWFEC
uniref:Uncharacterized protein n=1 Tax=Globisporangium ultimum (strain ATCC 200006 / CBS 805.95 / DAOM BR144) TaxID=431595 RepID=K3WBM3_GLOUD